MSTRGILNDTYLDLEVNQPCLVVAIVPASAAAIAGRRQDFARPPLCLTTKRFSKLFLYNS